MSRTVGLMRMTTMSLEGTARRLRALSSCLRWNKESRISSEASPAARSSSSIPSTIAESLFMSALRAQHHVAADLHALHLQHFLFELRGVVHLDLQKENRRIRRD